MGPLFKIAEGNRILMDESDWYLLGIPLRDRICKYIRSFKYCETMANGSVIESLNCTMDPLVKFKDPKEDTKEMETLAHREARLFAFWAVVVSTASVITAIITLPAMYTSLHTLRSEIGQEADFCRLRVRDFWIEMYSMGRGDPADLLNDRQKRSWLFGQWVSDTPGNAPNAYGESGGSAAPSGGYGGYDSPAPPPSPAFANPYDSGAQPPVTSDNYGIQLVREPAGYGNSPPASSPHDVYPAQPIYTSAPASPPSVAPPPASVNTPPAPSRSPAPAADSAQCPCSCQQGPPGPPGPAGDNGNDGKDGTPGASGEAGRSGAIISHEPTTFKEPCIICPVGLPGPGGQQGPRGPPGPRGSNGTPGIDGRRGEPGMPGPPGPPGLTGTMGPQGPVGPNGRQFMLDSGPRGPPGKPGPAGAKGIPGCQGTPGGVVMGPKGASGDPGRPGRDGHKGQPGANGLKGAPGTNGDCQHCPLPRTPPGY